MQAALPEYLIPAGSGVYAVDTGFLRPRFDAAWLVVERGRAAFIDTGTARALPRLLGALEALGLARDAVDWIIPTHVHLDHAGGVGQLAQALPAARVLVHPRGARHLLDPAQLWAGATAVYGTEEMARSYGSLEPVAAGQLVESADGQVVDLAGRALRIAHTPGHARHHHCIWDEATRGWFTGDTFGLSYREFDTARGPWMLPTSTPVQFEPEVLRSSIERLLAARPAWVYLTHFGRVGQVQALGLQLLALLDRLVAMARGLRDAPGRHDRLKEGQLELFAASLAAHGCTMPREQVALLLALDMELNAQGLGIWLDRR